MPAQFVRGTTFSPGATVSAATLHSLLVDASLSGIDQSNLDTAQGRTINLIDSGSDLEDGDVGVDRESYWLMTQLLITTHEKGSAVPHGRQAMNDGSRLTGGEVVVATDFEADPASSSYPDIIIRKALTTDDPWRVAGIAATGAKTGFRTILIPHGVVRVKTDNTALSPGQSATLSDTVDGAIMALTAEVGYGKLGRVIAKDGSYAWLELSRL